MDFYPSTEEFNRLSQALAEEQRGEPEKAMLRIQMSQIAQLYGYIAEHTGDLINRMAQHPEYFHGQYDAVYSKVKKVLNTLNSKWQGFMPFEKDYEGQIRSNVQFMKENPEPYWKWNTYEEAYAELKKRGHAYAEAHRKLKPLNEAQRLAQEAAIAVGEFQFDNARRALESLEKVLDKGFEEWSKYATRENAGALLEQPEIIRQYDLGKVPKSINLPPRVNIPPVKGSASDYIKQEKAKSEMPEVPLNLTMEEYNSFWKPQGWNIIFIGPTKTWRSEWGTWEAIREIVQNALDEAESYSYGFEETGFYIKDTGRGIGVRDFLLGPPKLKENWARGKYGEGMKIGALALVRAGYPVYVEAGARQVIVCFLEQDVQGKVETLAALWRQGKEKVGTTWHILRYTEDDFADRFYVNLPKEATKALIPSTINKPKQRYNALIQYDFLNKAPAASAEFMSPKVRAKSRVFARDIYMQDIDSPFSYNLWGFDLAPDRHAPKDENDLWSDIGRVWSCIKDPTLLETFVKMVSEPPIIPCDESQRVRLSYLGNLPDGGRPYMDILNDNKEVWKKAWDKVQGSDAVIRTSARWDATVKHLGYKSVTLGYNARDGLSAILTTDKALIDASQEKLRDVAIIPDEKLTSRQLASLKLVRRVVEFTTSSWNTVGGVHAAVIPPASDRVRTAGLYSRTTREIYIAPDQLEYGHLAVDVGIHELAHHTSQSEDGEKGHYEEISNLAGRVVSYTASRQFDNQIADPDFVW